MSVKLSVSGDFCITAPYLSKEILTEKIIGLFSGCDLNIVNLECPVNNDGEKNKIIKNGPHLQTKAEIFRHLRQLNISAVTLANNHILDYGAEGLQSTIECCKKSNIAYTGAGKNLKDAATPLVIERNGVRIAIVNCCENEWSVAGEDKAGANPLDIIENLAQIKKAKAIADFVMVIIHGGSEYYNLPSPRMVKQYRFFAENGASAVIGHHTHCLNGFEVHNNVPVFYGLGNMLFTIPTNQPGWFTGLTVKFTLEKDQPLQWELVPTGQSKENFELSLLEGEKKQEVLREIESYSEIIADSQKLTAHWAAFIRQRKAQYLQTFSALNLVPGKYFRSALKRLGFVNKLFPKKYLLPVMNYVFCEAHLDVIKEALNSKLSEK